MKAGFISIIGKPNSGKSTLANQLLGSYLSIVTPKAQTTRKNILGILTENNYQIIILDTPGILKPQYKLHEYMLSSINRSIDDADILLVLIDITKFKNLKNYLNETYFEILSKINKTKIAVINKIDLIKNDDELKFHIEQINKENFFNEIVTISAFQGKNIGLLKQTIVKYLPDSDFLYEDDLISTLPIKFFVAEIIRENIFYLYNEEIPYSTHVNLREFKEKENGKWYISADITVERLSQKKIIIGKNGEKIKELGIKSRKQIQDYLNQEVYLELFVNIKNNWRKENKYLKSFGYLQ